MDSNTITILRIFTVLERTVARAFERNNCEISGKSPSVHASVSPCSFSHPFILITPPTQTRYVISSRILFTSTRGQVHRLVGHRFPPTSFACMSKRLLVPRGTSDLAEMSDRAEMPLLTPNLTWMWPRLADSWTHTIWTGRQQPALTPMVRFPAACEPNARIDIRAWGPAFYADSIHAKDGIVVGPTISTSSARA